MSSLPWVEQLETEESGLVCQKSGQADAVELLDLYEGRVLNLLIPLKSNLSYPKLAEEKVAELQTTMNNRFEVPSLSSRLFRLQIKKDHKRWIKLDCWLPSTRTSRERPR